MNNDTFTPADPERFARALRRFDAVNAEDPNRETENGVEHPRELLYAERLTRWVLRLRPNASEALRLAARCQHIRRWDIPRNTCPATREGYLKWKETLKRHHARVAGEILREVGYPEEIIQRVQSLNLKRNLTQDPECQTMEDALCLVFLEHQLAPLADKVAPDKVIAALRKSWARMSEAGRAAALKLQLAPREADLLRQALASASS